MDKAESGIAILESIAKEEILNFKKVNFFKSLVALLELDQVQLIKFIRLFINKHESWLVESEYHEELICVFESQFAASLDKLSEPAFNQLISFAEKKLKEEKDTKNIPLHVFLHEAVLYNFREPSDEDEKIIRYPIREYDAKVKDVYEVLFSCCYQSSIKIDSDRMSYCQCGDESHVGLHAFGGSIDGLETDEINRIITIDPFPEGLGVKSVKALTIGLNSHQAFWVPIELDQAYYIQHDENGNPVKELTSLDKKSIEYYNEAPIAETEVKIDLTPKKYIHHYNTGNEWRIGGSPLWIQDPQEVKCIKCNEKMKFIIQLPSGGLKNINGDGVYYGSDGGITYGHWCDKDRIMAYIWQDT